jgi:hypothetical protein
MNENEMLCRIAQLVKENRDLRKALSDMLDRLDYKKSTSGETFWAQANLEYDRELEFARDLLRHTSKNENLQ